jgi:exosome complex component RRP41
MASFSVEERKRPGPDRRSYELSKVSREALEPVILTSFFPRSVIDVFVEVLQADAGTRTAGINAAAVALADAGIPMKSMISSCAAGKVADTIVLDPMKEEDNFGQADLPIAMTPNGNITLMQMDGGLSPEEFHEAVEMAMRGARDIYELQRKALVDKYSELVAEPEKVEVQAND